MPRSLALATLDSPAATQAQVFSKSSGLMARLRPLYLPAFFTGGNPLSLTLTDDGALKLHKRSQNAEHEDVLRVGGILRKRQALLEKVHACALGGDLVDDAARIHQGAGDPIDGGDIGVACGKVKYPTLRLGEAP